MRTTTPPPTPTPARDTTEPRKELPKTASSMPLIGWVGAAALFLGLASIAARRGRRDVNA